MCIITFHYNDHVNYRLIVCANRDEFYDRPTAQAHFWEDKRDVLAGRDLEAMGTWLGMTKSGRFAALTNYRDPKEFHKKRRSRGHIVANFLSSNDDPQSYLEEIQREKDEYNGFNVLCGTMHSLYYYSNRNDDIMRIPPGTHSISNHLINTPWPKVVRAKQMLKNYVSRVSEVKVEELFYQLKNNELAPDEQLPNTGIDRTLEKQLSPIFIQTDGYGTRSSTVILVTHDGEVTFVERTYQNGIFHDERTFQFNIKTR